MSTIFITQYERICGGQGVCKSYVATQSMETLGDIVWTLFKNNDSECGLYSSFSIDWVAVYDVDSSLIENSGIHIDDLVELCKERCGYDTLNDRVITKENRHSVKRTIYNLFNYERNKICSSCLLQNVTIVINEEENLERVYMNDSSSISLNAERCEHAIVLTMNEIYDDV